MKRLRFKQFLTERNQLSKTGEEALLSVSEYYGVKPRAEAFEGEEHETRAATLEGYRIVRKDDLVMNYMLAWKGAYGTSKYNGIVSPAYSVFRINQDIVDVRYLHHRVRSDEMRAYFRSRSKGIIESRLRLYPDMLLASFIEIPNLPTQRAIADFLDRETARIDLLIEKKLRLVELLGLNAKARQLSLVTGQHIQKRKQSNIIWAPTIPEHWEERAVWMLFSLGRGRVLSHDYIAENGGEYPIFSSQTSDDGIMGYINTFDFEGDYLTWTTDGAKAGTVFRRKGKFNCTNVCGTLKPLSNDIDLEFSRFALDMATDFFVRHDINPKLMNGVMSKIRIPFPPLSEQREIGSSIGEISRKNEPILEKTNTSIDSLREYRSSLITAAVTGQIDVTKWVKAGTADRKLDAVQATINA